jgi:hypothetical protein
MRSSAEWTGLRLSELELDSPYTWATVVFGMLFMVVTFARTVSRDAEWAKEIRAREDAARVESDEKECPVCAEHVKARAKRCRFCGYDFSETTTAEVFRGATSNGAASSSAASVSPVRPPPSKGPRLPSPDEIDDLDESAIRRLHADELKRRGWNAKGWKNATLGTLREELRAWSISERS